MSNANKELIDKNYQIILFKKDSFEDLVMRGFTRKEIEKILGFNFKNENEYYKLLRPFKSSNLFKHHIKHYKLEFIKNNFTPQQILFYFKQLSSSKLLKESYDFLGVKKGSRPNYLLASDIFEYLNMKEEYKQLILFYKEKTSLEVYGTPHPQSHQSVKSKTRQTFLNKYGVDNPSKLDATKEKSRQTSLRKYGVEHPSQSTEVKEAHKKYWLDNYGVETNLQLDSTKKKIKETNLKKYGVENPMQCDSIKKKAVETVKEKYGVDNVLILPENRDKQREKMIELFGSPSAFSSPEVRKSIENTNLERYGTKTYTQSQAYKEFNLEKYGVEHPMQLRSIKDAALASLNKISIEKYGIPWPYLTQTAQIKAIEKLKQTSLDKYGTEWPFHSKTSREKAFATKRKNGTFNTSSPEDNLHIILLEKFGSDNVFRNDNTHSEYPFAVDFYIKSQNLYIEYNGLWTHGKHFFDENSQEDQELLKKWQSKAETSKYYRNAINVWTNKDPKKRETAKNNNLNYVVLWNWNDVEEWISSGFELRKDY